MTLSLAVGSPSTFAANPGTLRLDQASEVREIRHLLARGRLDPPAATARLLAVRDQAPRHPAWLGTLGWVICPPGIALILQPMWSSVAVATVAGIAVTALVQLSQRAPRFTAPLPVVAAFVVACIVFAAARHGLVEAPLRTLLAPLAVLLPGALLVTAMAELVTGHMVAGTSRLGYGLVQVLLFTLGILGAARLLPLASADLANVRINDIGWYAAPLGLVLVTLAIALLESPPPRLVPWIFVVLVLAFGAQVAGQALGGAVGGAFLGALVATASVYMGQGAVGALAGSGLILAMLGFAIRNVVADTLSGIALGVEGPFRIGDWVDIEGLARGKVIEIGWRTTRLLTRDWTYVILPNSQIARQRITNYSAPKPEYRAQVSITLDHSMSIGRAREVMLEALKGADLIQQDPAPDVRVLAYEEGGITYALRYWLSRFDRDIDCRDEVYTLVDEALRRAGTIAPYRRIAVIPATTSGDK